MVFSIGSAITNIGWGPNPLVKTAGICLALTHISIKVANKLNAESPIIAEKFYKLASYSGLTATALMSTSALESIIIDPKPSWSHILLPLANGAVYLPMAANRCLDHFDPNKALSEKNYWLSNMVGSFLLMIAGTGDGFAGLAIAGGLNLMGSIASGKCKEQYYHSDNYKMVFKSSSEMPARLCKVITKNIQL